MMLIFQMKGRRASGSYERKSPCSPSTSHSPLHFNCQWERSTCRCWEHWKEATGRLAQWRGERATCMCPSKTFSWQMYLEENQFAWGASVGAFNGICEQSSRRPAGMKALSASTAKAQQLSSSGVRHWKAPGIWGGQPLPLTPPQPDRLGHERESLLQTELPEPAVAASSCGKGQSLRRLCSSLLVTLQVVWWGEGTTSLPSIPAAVPARTGPSPPLLQLCFFSLA